MPYQYELQETLLKVEGVNLDLGGRPILRDVHAEIKNIHRPGMQQGQVCALLGPSGIGKTQLFRILAGLNKPDSGQVFVTGESLPVTAGMVGVVAQHYPLFAHRSVMSNLLVAGTQGGLDSSSAEQKANQLLERFGLSGHEHKFPSQLSGGQRQRVAIAQQFMCSEHFLLMDEPFSGLDPIALDEMCEFVVEVAQTDELKTFIVVTHDIDAAVAVCDTLWLLGRDVSESGEKVPGARIQHVIDLAARGIAWRPNVRESQAFQSTVNEVRQLFNAL
jgi:NitT/TauT family transport system ATP-binding protein